MIMRFSRGFLSILFRRGWSKLNSGDLHLIVANLLWGSGSIFTRLADQPATVIMFFRAAAAFSTVAAYLLLRRQPLGLNGVWRWTLASGVLISLSGLFFFLAVQTTTIGTAVLACNTGPIFYITWSCLFLGEKFERRTLLALPLAATGIILLVSNCEISLTSRDFVGILYGLASGLSYSFVVIIAKRFPHIPTASLILVQMGVAAVLFSPWVVLNPPVLTIQSLGAMTVLGVVHSGLCLALYFNALKTVKLQHAGILGYLDPASAVLYAYLFFGEVPTLATVLGGLCILSAGALTLQGSAGTKREDGNKLSSGRDGVSPP